MRPSVFQSEHRRGTNGAVPAVQAIIKHEAIHKSRAWVEKASVPELIEGNPTVDPVHVVQALVDTLLDVFDATRDLYETLTVKEQRDYEQNLRSKGYPASRRIEYVKDERLGSDEAIVTDKAVVTRQFDIGYQTIGVEFAEGDVIAYTALQSQIITLQSVLVTTFLYGPTSGEPIANQLASINTASRVAAATPVNTTVLTWRDNVEPEPSITDATSMTGPTLASRSNNLYCVYAYDLQRSPTQQLSSSITSDRDPYCPHCKGALHLSPGKAWEISKWAGDTERTFQVQNRFVVKCHRDGPDGQYCCVICSKYAESDTVCGDVKALIKHLSDDHDVRELKHEEDIVEVIEQPGSRRDSGLGFASSKGSRRSASLASGRRRKSLPAYDREVDVFDVRSSRR
ncbi:hypothetical protein J4E82_011572 [Alternaria postmessia]|uniref:uncharacterized protein n=1 Tax=Alternaria postmessia TaxID=1187938 RepID=UPI0022240CF2|nr:uncharacterized protein J4E82_011572 [Alternaria postmessia]KAI5363465.1 hypothetical protein J4E82_011572 [Alternaria postmessia]